MVIYVISDVHTDYPVNMQWVEELDSEKYKSDTLILPGKRGRDGEDGERKGGMR
jgi:hypothetical protein